VRKQDVKKVDGALANWRRKWHFGAWMIMSVDFLRRGPVRGGDGTFARRLVKHDPRNPIDDVLLRVEAHNLTIAPGHSNHLFQQNHCGMFRGDDGGAPWRSIEERLPSSFGLLFDANPRDPDTLFFPPLNGDTKDRPSRVRSDRFQPCDQRRATYDLRLANRGYCDAPLSPPPCSLTAASSQSREVRRVHHVNGANSAVKCRSAGGSLTISIPFRLSFTAATSAKVSTI